MSVPFDRVVVKGSNTVCFEWPFGSKIIVGQTYRSQSIGNWAHGKSPGWEP